MNDDDKVDEVIVKLLQVMLRLALDPSDEGHRKSAEDLHSSLKILTQCQLDPEIRTSCAKMIRDLASDPVISSHRCYDEALAMLPYFSDPADQGLN